MAVCGSAPRALAQQEEPTGVTQMVIGEAVWVPTSKDYKPGKGWLALACGATDCALEPARLKLSKAQWQGHYDDGPTAGYRLNFTRVGKSPRKPIAWIRKTPRLPWLKPGPIASYGSIVGGIAPAHGQGTLEIELKPPAGAASRLVPLLHKQEDKFLLQLRSGSQRQMLGELASCEHEVHLTYLQWAGDLDGDGKTDYLIDPVSSVGSTVLHVSSLATSSELVGVAAVGVSDPYGGECDGRGWLEQQP